MANIATRSPAQEARALIYGADRYGNKFNPSVDPRLLDVIQTAASQFPMKVVATSGLSGRSTGTKNHPSGRAIDIQIFDQNDKPIPNYVGKAIGASQMVGNPYAQFAAVARQVQEQKYPGLSQQFRWGGGFMSGVNPGDLMHFDISGGLPGTPPLPGTWATLAKLYPPGSIAPEQVAAADPSAPADAMAYSPDKLASGQAAISDWMGTPLAPQPIATAAPVVSDIMTPPALADIPASPTGADAVVRGSIEGDPAHLTSAWNQLITNVMAGGEKARSAASDYIARSPIPTKLAMASAFAWNPDLWKSVPAIGFPGQPTVRDTARLASEDLMTGGHAADQMPFGIGPSLGELSTPIYSDTRATAAPAERPAVYESSRIASPAMGSPARDPLQQVTNDYKGYIPGGMATTAPPAVKPDAGPGLDESMSYAMSDIVGSPVQRPATMATEQPALAYVPEKVAAPSVAPAPTRNIATVGPSQKPTMLNRIFGKPGMQTYNNASTVAQSVIAAAHAAGLGVSPFTPSGYHAPDFSSGSGGATKAWQSDPNNPGHGTFVNSYGQTMPF